MPITPLTDFMGFISALSDNRTPQKPSGKKLNSLCCSLNVPVAVTGTVTVGNFEAL
jgi:hypothetical protein